VVHVVVRVQHGDDRLVGELRHLGANGGALTYEGHRIDDDHALGCHEHAHVAADARVHVHVARHLRVVEVTDQEPSDAAEERHDREQPAENAHVSVP
jgi:hypothetical protein